VLEVFGYIFSQYEYLALFLSTLMGIVASPVPDEVVVRNEDLAAGLATLFHYLNGK
jgi:hypothetical protein